MEGWLAGWLTCFRRAFNTACRATGVCAFSSCFSHESCSSVSVLAAFAGAPLLLPRGPAISNCNSMARFLSASRASATALWCSCHSCCSSSLSGFRWLPCMRTSSSSMPGRPCIFGGCSEPLGGGICTLTRQSVAPSACIALGAPGASTLLWRLMLEGAANETLLASEETRGVGDALGAVAAPPAPWLALNASAGSGPVGGFAKAPARASPMSRDMEGLVIPLGSCRQSRTQKWRSLRSILFASSLPLSRFVPAALSSAPCPGMFVRLLGCSDAPAPMLLLLADSKDPATSRSSAPAKRG
mmetsp:Transcript_2917/g.7585  ORF Transcript_2917/g.7585 Transcript_2917/m.7585 type:complete len:300 (+) Transcript_2917:1598-2497(+)